MTEANFRSGSAGGRRHCKFTIFQEKLIQFALWKLCKQNPSYTSIQYQKALEKEGWVVSNNYVLRIFKQWRWSWKIPDRKNINKYTIENICYYAEYLFCIYNIPWEKLHFIDESHVFPKKLNNNLVVGPVGKTSNLMMVDSLDHRFSITMMTSLKNLPSPCVVDIRTESNTQFDFFNFVQFAITYKYLVAGDFLIMDNASIHCASETLETLINIAQASNVMLRVLPKYSPELNPCELTFAYVKRFVSHNRVRGLSPWYLIAVAFSKVTQQMMRNYYRHCIKITSQK